MSTAAFAEDMKVADTEDSGPGFYYTVQKGDTLWDLSRKFYDSQWVWPAMWKQNDQLTNPHWIYPGQRIRLHERTDAMAANDVPQELPPEPPEEMIEQAPEEAPAPEETPVYFFMEEITHVGFLKKLPKSALGRFDDPFKIGSVFKVESADDQQMISQGDTIYIVPEKDETLIIGSKYFLYKPIDRVINKAGGYAGHQYRFIGIAEVTAADASYAVADVVKSYLPIRLGDSVMALQKRNPEIPLAPEPAGLKGTIVINEDHENMSTELSIVFIDKGEKDGVMPGQRYNVYYQEEDTVNGKKVLLPPVVYGSMLVLLTQDETATAIITNATTAIPPGATFQSPTT